MAKQSNFGRWRTDKYQTVTGSSQSPGPWRNTNSDVTYPGATGSLERWWSWLGRTVTLHQLCDWRLMDRVFGCFNLRADVTEEGICIVEYAGYWTVMWSLFLLPYPRLHTMSTALSSKFNEILTQPFLKAEIVYLLVMCAWATLSFLAPAVLLGDRDESRGTNWW